MKQVAIVGFGRFGQLLARILGDEFDVVVVESDGELRVAAKEQGYKVVPLQDVAKADVVFLAVPIANLASVLKQLASIVRKEQIVMDVCSVKVYPAKLMQQYLPDAQTLATHPLFGPDSARTGLNGLKLAFCPLNIDKKNLTFWQKFWEGKGVEVIQTTPEVHDHDMIYSLGLTQTLARVIGRMDLPNMSLTTKGFDAVKKVADFSLSDTDQLYHDMLYYNPYFQEMKQRLAKASAKTLHQLDHISEEQNLALRTARDS